MKEHRSILDLFKKEKPNQTKVMTTFKELGTFKSSFGYFGNNVYNSDDVRACVRALSEHTSKANPKCTNKELERLLTYNPNQYMNGKDMLAKLRNILEIKNTAFLYIERDNANKVIGFYPVPYLAFEVLEYKDRTFVQFNFNGEAARNLVVAWEDLAILRKDYLFSDFAGESNLPLIKTLDVINTVDSGLQNAIKSTSNLRGILKSTKAMLSPEDLKKQKQTFVTDYLNLENESGIASLDATQEFKEINLKPTTATAEEADAYRERIYRYFGVNKKIIQSSYSESEYDAFYEARIEPFLVALSLELTRKIFSPRELAFGNEIWFESNRLQYASAKTKLGMVSLVDRGLMTPNEFRALFNMSPYDGGDEFVLRLDTSKTGDTTGDDGTTGNPVGRPEGSTNEEGESDD
jgi:HK97 family phage portal protein